MLTNDDIKNLIEGVMIHGPEILSKCVSHAEELAQYQKRLEEEFLDYEIPKTSFNPTNWLIPAEYKQMNIEELLVNQCPKENLDRLAQELELFHSHNMIPVLRVIKYIVDTLRENRVVWGVRRGSSVASYVLFLIGIHKVDPIKYDIPIDEFFKGEKNG